MFINYVYEYHNWYPHINYLNQKLFKSILCFANFVTLQLQPLSNQFIVNWGKEEPLKNQALLIMAAYK